MIKTDKVIYRTRTITEYDWLMDRLDEAGCEWQGGGSPICGKEICDSTKSDSYVFVENETISFLDEDYSYEYTDNLDYEIIEVSDLMKRTIKTDKVIYHVRTQKEYNWLMKKLEADGCKWANGKLPTELNDWIRYSTKMGIDCKDKIIAYSNIEFCKSDSAYKDYEFIEVSDLMSQPYEVRKYRKRPVIIEAIKYDKDHIGRLLNFCEITEYNPHDNEYYVKTLEGNMKITYGDYIIKGINGEFYPCKADIFEKTYERVEQEND